jgi:ATP synthase protein I
MFFSKDGRLTNIVQVGGTAGTMGLHIVSAIIVGLVIGYHLDEWLGTKPYLIMIFFLLGVVAGFKMVFEDFRKLQRRQEEQQHSSLKQEGKKSAGDD